MRKLSAFAYGRRILCLFLILLSVHLLRAQITVTSPLPSSFTTFSSTAAGAIVFGVKNTNATPITITDIGNYVPSGFSGTLTLWYRTTSVTGAPTAITTANSWVSAATKALSNISTAGITPVFTGLNITVPANTTYRFAISGPAGSPLFGDAGSTVNKYEGGGLEICVQDNANSPGYGGAFPGPPAATPRSFIGSITFKPTVACTDPPVAGTAMASATSVCAGTAFNLNLSGGSIGMGQIYQWQSSTDNVNWTNIGASSFSSGLIITQTAPTYYRAAVTCGANTTYSTSVQVFNNPRVAGNTFTINKAVPTGGTNFQSFNDAYNYMKCGIDGPMVFNVVSGSGPYDEQLIMQPIPGTSATNTITFNGNGNTLTYLSTNSTERAVIKLNGADYVTFNDLVITARGASSGQYGYGAHLLNDADFNTFSNCTININQSSNLQDFAGIVVSNSLSSATGAGAAKCDSNTFRNNTISGGYYGITLVGATTEAAGGAIGGNKVIKNTIKDFYSYGIYASGTYKTLIEGNTITRPERTTVTDFYGIYFTGLSTMASVTKNTITNPFGAVPAGNNTFYGINFSSVSALSTFENIISNNKIYNLSGSSWFCYGFYNNASGNCWYYHNTISMDGSPSNSATTHLTYGFYQTTKADGIEFKNNIITISRGGLSAKTVMYMNTNTTTMVSDRNDFYISSTAGVNTIGFWNAKPQVSLASWRSATGQDARSVSTNPVYTDLATGNLKPQNASIDNLGTPVGILVDFDSTTRQASTPDIGAYEFAPLACVTPPVVGTIAVSETPVCSETPVMLTVSGNSYGAGQVYQWQYANTAAGPFANLGTTLTNPDTAIIAPSINLYYRLAVTCSGQTGYSEPVLLAVNQPLLSGAYTINKNAPASATNFVSFNAAKAAMGCGITGPVVFDVVKNSGPYVEQLILDSIRGTSPINTVTFKAHGDTIRFASAPIFSEVAIIKLNGADYITIDSLVINPFNYGVQFINNADFNTIRNCTINLDKTSTSSALVGIVMSSSHTSATLAGATLCDNNTIENNTINGGNMGITVVGSTSATIPTISNNRVINNKIRDYYSSGMYISGTSSTLAEGNEISRPTRTNSPNPVYGIQVTGVSDGLRISKNRIYNPFGGMLWNPNPFYGIYFTNADAPIDRPNIVSNNLVYNANGQGIIYGIRNDGSDNVSYYHNTIALDDAANPSANATYGFYQTTDAEGIELKNNLMTITRSGTGFRYGLYFNTATTRFASDYNNIYQSAGVKSILGFLTADRAALADWKAATGKDLNSGTVDPVYSDSAAGNFKPKTPGMDNRGTGVGITTDIVGVARSASSPDVGAYEYTVPACTAPPAAGTATATPSSGMCMGTPVVLSLNGNTFGSGISFQWEYATAASGPYLALGAPKVFPDTVIEASTTLYYRAAVTCSGNTQYSTPVLVSINPAFMAGTYTIDPGQPASSTNFTSFASAVANLECGIAGAVTFKVAPGTYTEQVRMHKIAGATANSRVTFQSADGNPISVVLKYTATSAANNYVLKLDSASYITYKDMTLTSIDSVNGRVIELANTASYDSLVNLVVNAPVNDTTGTSVGGIYAVNLKGGGHVIKGNTINNGANGIYWRGTSETLPTTLNIIEGNTVNAAYHHGIHVYYTSRVKITNNTVNQASALNNTSYGIYAGYCDTAYQVVGNKVIISNAGNAKANINGISINYCDGTSQERGKVAGNTVLATNNIAGNVYGLSNSYSTYSNVANNVVSIKTTGDSSYALYSFNDDNTNYYNNSIYSTSTSASINHAAYFYHGNNTVDIRNNIFAHNGGGKAFYTYNPAFTSSDYNQLYSSGTVLVQTGIPNAFYPALQGWRNAYLWDMNSIVYKPAFVSDDDLRPNVDSPDVWAMHGRGVQIPGNDYDFNNNTRPTTLTAGVPDLGAYEFVPTSVPPILTAIPAAPAPGITQTFMFGTDTVSKITWGATVPATISMRRYSGVTPPGLTPATPHMYYYTDVQTTGTNATGFSKRDFFIDPWQGWINYQYQIRLGKTDPVGSWTVGASSVVDSTANVITENGLGQLFRFTGMADVRVAPPPPAIPMQTDSANTGKRFWVGYANSYDFKDGNNQEMVLYLSTGAEPATVTVKVNGTGWVRTYNIPANTAITTDKLPKTGFFDSRLLGEGKSANGIGIESNVPIVAYAHIYSYRNSGATMLLPVGTYGYEYYSLNARQSYVGGGGKTSQSSFFVVADNDNTNIEITPSNPTLGGRPANVPFVVTLNKGEVYQVLGANLSDIEGYDLTGSKIMSVPNGDGKCYPIAVFAGSSRTRLGCGASAGDGGDLLFQQVFPSQAWGKRYLTAPASIAASPQNFQGSIYRVMVKDPATVVKVNGSILSGLVNDRYYQYESNTADYIEADKPVMVAQYMASAGGSCTGSSSYVDGDPELFYLSPIEQAIKQTRIYRNNLDAITVNYLTLTIPTAGLASLTIDGSNTFNYAYPHPNLPGYSVVVKQWGNATGQSWVQSDSAFTGIVYGEGYQESYGYNLGTLVKNLNVLSSITNTLSATGGTSEYTCTNSPFKVSVLVPVKPTALSWKFSQAQDLVPNADVTLVSPVAVDSVTINNKKYYKYVVSQDYKFSKAGTYDIPVSYTHPEIEGCNHSLQTVLTVKVVQAPLSDFTVDYTNCVGDIARFSGSGGAGVNVIQWNWNMGDGSTATIQKPSRQYAAPGTYDVNLKLVTQDGCLGDTTRKVQVNGRPLVDVVKDSLAACNGSSVTFNVKTPQTGTTYNWYNAATGTNPLGSVDKFTATISGALANYYLEAVSNGCASTVRKKVTALLLPDLSQPVAVVDSAGVNTLRFRWSAVPDATGYEVSTDDGTTWVVPSSGSTGLTHTVNGLRPLQPVTLIVRTKGGCQDVQSKSITGKAVTDEVFIPNSFSPNGDGLNDVLQVYGYVVKEMQFTVFNQWGEKIYESKDQKRAWDGTHRGKLQPSGIYMYMCKLILNDGSVMNKKGSINLVR